MDKKQWRAFCKQRLEDADEEQLAAAGRRIVSRLLALPAYKQAESIFCYASKGREIDTFPILEDALANGKIVALPRITGRGRMEARWIASTEQLSPGAFGVPEPGADQPQLAADRIRLAVIPCLSCDLQGRRLGYGGGYYDRYLKKTDCLKVALCREMSLAFHLPGEEHDVLMDVIITERRTISIKKLNDEGENYEQNPDENPPG
ncbi:MAG: 5-formyltetrahydrofolate cyclo-ligase [Firmicutes bacterium]|nr:5-formyltetrahydrofolate cyclo-ligase [Bacillota bacterium]